jgi:hypothetical protein
MRHVFSLFVTITTILVTVGCGGTDKSANGKLNDQALLASLVTEFADTGANYTMVKYFKQGTKISQLDYKKYIKFNYKLDGNADISGDTAKATVKVMDANDGKEAGSKEWSFLKDGTIWKIKDAPLP